MLTEIIVASISGAAAIAAAVVNNRKKAALAEAEAAAAAKGARITSDVEANFKIDRTLYEILNDYQCDRVFLCRFHNGGKYASGTSMERFSLSNEVYRESVDNAISTRFQNRLISEFSAVMQKLIFEGLAQYDVEQAGIYVKSLLQPLETPNVALFCIYDTYNNPMAFLGIAVTPKIDPQDCLSIRSKAQSLLNLL